VLGGTAVVVRGANFHVPGSRGLFCKFVGADVVAASYEGEEAVRCATPPAAQAGMVAVHLINNDAVYVTSVAFQYQAAVSVSSVEPRTGVLSGGTLVRVLGQGFTPSMAAYVRVGAQPLVVARVLSGVLLECTTPSRTEPGLLAVEVTLNGQDFSADEVLFEYQPVAHVLEASPSKGPSAGGGLVNMTGFGFSQRSFLLSYMFARFNETRVPVVWVSATEVHCVAPEHATGVVHVEPGYPSEFQALSDWMREQSIFRVLSGMLLFKYFQTKKMFRMWRSTIRRASRSLLHQRWPRLRPSRSHGCHALVR
jgi:hypothetical protein